MFALLAAVCFLLVLAHAKVGTIDLTALGLLFIAVELFWPWHPWRRS